MFNVLGPGHFLCSHPNASAPRLGCWDPDDSELEVNSFPTTARDPSLNGSPGRLSDRHFDLTERPLVPFGQSCAELSPFAVCAGFGISLGYICLTMHVNRDGSSPRNQPSSVRLYLSIPRAMKLRT